MKNEGRRRAGKGVLLRSGKNAGQYLRPNLIKIEPSNQPYLATFRASGGVSYQPMHIS